jgi:hypothetical protein
MFVLKCEMCKDAETVGVKESVSLVAVKNSRCRVGWHMSFGFCP